MVFGDCLEVGWTWLGAWRVFGCRGRHLGGHGGSLGVIMGLLGSILGALGSPGGAGEPFLRPMGCFRA